MKKILVAVDFSDNAMNALVYAFKLANDNNAKLYVTTVLPPLVDPMNTNLYIGQLIRDQINSTKNQMSNFIEKAIAETDITPVDVAKFSVVVSMGNIVKEINDIVTQESIDMILLGSRGNNHSRWEKLMGTVSSGIAEKAKVPVLVIPVDNKYNPVKKIAFASSLMDSDFMKIYEASELLHFKECDLKIVNVNNEKGEINQKKIDLFKSLVEEKTDCKSVNFYAINDDQVDADIVIFSKSFDVDVLIINQTHHSLWNRLFGKSHTRDLASMVDWPLLVMK